MKLQLLYSIMLLPPLLVTGLVQDFWFMYAYMEWQYHEPISYWLTRLASLGILVFTWKRLRER